MAYIVKPRYITVHYWDAYIAKGHNDFNDANDIYWQKRKTITYFTVCLYIVLQTKVKIGNGILIKSDIILYLQYS